MDRRSFIAASLSIAAVACSKSSERSTSLGSGTPNPVYPCSVLNSQQSQYLHLGEQVVAAGGWGFEALGVSGVANTVRLVDQQLRSGAIDISYSSPSNPCDAGCLGVLPSVTVASSSTVAVANLQEGCSFTFLLSNAFCGGVAHSLADSVLLLGAFSATGRIPARYVLVFPSLEKLVVFDGQSYAVIPGTFLFAQASCQGLGVSGEPIGTAIFSLVWPVISPQIFQNTELVRFLPLNVRAVGCPGGDCTGFSGSCASPPACTVFSVCQGAALQELTYLTAAQNVVCVGS